MENYITENDILDESRECFLTYAEEVLTDRAIPSAEDGLLSVHRKLLWTMSEILKMNSKSKTKKSASIVGSTLASSYFHGDASCYGALCKIAQTYLMRYPLVDGQGSLGTQEANGMQASSRYTEAKPSKFADLMMQDYKKKVVPTVETYNNEYFEPVVLPAAFPNALVNGREAIGISMSHCSLPHNLNEVCDALIDFINKDGNVDTKAIMQYIKGPDFPLGGTVINSKDIYTAFDTGHSAVSLKVRGDYEIKDNQIIFTSIPYRTYRNKIKEQITKNAEELEKVIDDFSDESSRGQNRLIFTVKKGINPEDAVKKLFALTSLQTTLSYNMNFIVNGTPKMCSMKDLLNAYYIHRTNVLLNATKFDKDNAEKRLHILEGLAIALTSIDEVIELIKSADNKTDALNKLLKRFTLLDDIQAKAILDLKLARLTKLDNQEIQDEIVEKKNIINECNLIIENKEHRNAVLIKQIQEIKEKYGDERRTQLLNLKIEKEVDEIAEVVPEDMVVIISKTGNIKRIPASSFKVQKRKGKGIKSIDDTVLEIISTNTIDTLMFFTDKGKMYRLLVNDVPIGTNTTQGSYVGNFIKLEPTEKIIAMTSLYRKTNAEYAIFITKNGLVKKTYLQEYLNVKRNSGVIAIKLKEGDTIANVTFLKDEDLVLITEKGMAIRFSTTEITPISRNTCGVKCIKLNNDDRVLSGLPVHNEQDYIAFVTSNGLAKKIPLKDFPLQGRGGKGLTAYKLDNMTLLRGAEMVCDEDNILLIGTAKSICISTQEIPKASRASNGNIMFNGTIHSVVKI